jgi:hypothetical protein
MRQNLEKRLGRLETVSAAACRARAVRQAGSSAAEQLRETLRGYGFVPGPDESLASTFARALGVSDPELDRRLRSGSLRAAEWSLNA